MSLIYYLAMIVFLLLCVLLCTVVLVQEGKSGGGMGGLGMGGADSGDSLFGTSTPEILRSFTGWLVFAFFAGCVVLSLWTTAFEHRRNVAPARFAIEDVQTTE